MNFLKSIKQFYYNLPLKLTVFHLTLRYYFSNLIRLPKECWIKITKQTPDPKINTRQKINGHRLCICGYSLEGFKEEKERNKVMQDFTYEHCKHWGWFGDGLCFTCHYPGKKCPFSKLTENDIK